MARNITLTIAAVSIAVLTFSYIAPKGWHTSGSAESKYDMGTIRYGGHDSSKSCGTIKATKGRYFHDDYGLLLQSFSAKAYLGKRIRMTGYMRTRGVESWAGFMLRVDKNGKKEPLYFDNMAERKITGNTNWLEYRVEADVPNDATGISFGALLNGSGQIWFDDFRFEVIGNYASTADTSAADASLPKGPTNLDFEL